MVNIEWIIFTFNSKAHIVSNKHPLRNINMVCGK